MEAIKAFFNAIGDIEKQYWKTALWIILFTLIFGLLPTWITLFMFNLHSISINIQDVTDNGQFAIYSAALISSGLYFVAREFNTHKFRGRGGFLLILFILVVLASLLVGSATISGKVNLPINTMFLRYSSIIIFILTVPIVFICAAKNEAGVAEDYRAIYSKSYRELDKKFKPPKKYSPPKGDEDERK
jgi:hypothetical protein